MKNCIQNLKPKVKYMTKLLVVVFFFLQSCKQKCKTPPDQYFYIKSDALSVVPYQGFETLKFIYNNYDTQVFYGSGKSKYYTITPYGNPECPQGDEYYEGYSIKFKSMDNAILFDQHVYGPGPSSVNVAFNHQTFKKPSLALLPPFQFDSLFIGGKWHDSLYNLNYSGFDSAYYSASEGIIKFKIGSDKWEIIN